MHHLNTKLEHSIANGSHDTIRGVGEIEKPSIMSVTTTDNPVTSTIASALQDYEIHLTGERDLPPRHVWAPLTDHNAPPAENPEGWEDSFRGVPNYRPVNTELDRLTRPWGSNGVESAFVFLMLNGVWLTGVSHKKPMLDDTCELIF